MIRQPRWLSLRGHLQRVIGMYTIVHVMIMYTGYICIESSRRMSGLSRLNDKSGRCFRIPVL